MWAWACGLRSTAMYVMPRSCTSPVYFPAPVMRRGASFRLTAAPISLDPWPETMADPPYEPMMGGVSDLHCIRLDPQAEFIPIDEQSEDNIMQLGRLGKTDRLAHQAFDPGA